MRTLTHKYPRHFLLCVFLFSLFEILNYALHFDLCINIDSQDNTVYTRHRVEIPTVIQDRGSLYNSKDIGLI